MTWDISASHQDWTGAPQVSFVIPAYNEIKNIRPCLQSIHDELNSNLRIRAEIITVDNGSKDGTNEVAAEYGDVVYCWTKGIVFARQRGFMAARGNLIAFIDADNILPQGWLLKAIKPFKNKKVVAISGPVIYHDLSKTIRFLSKIFYGMAWVCHQIFPILQGGNFVVRRLALSSVGGFDTQALFYGEDSLNARRLSKVGSIRFILGLKILSSGRRLAKVGIVKTTWLYVLSYFWANLTGKPVTQKYEDVR